MAPGSPCTRPSPFPGLETDLHRRPDQAPEEPLPLRHHRVEVEGSGLQGLLPAEGQELAGEVGRLPRDLLDVLDGLPDGLRGNRLAPSQLQAQDVAVGRDRHQHVVEVVGHPSRELADRVHLLGLAQLLLEPPVVRDVDGGDEGVGGAFEIDDVERDEHGAVAGARAHPDLAVPKGALLRVDAEHFPSLGRADDPDLHRRLAHELLAIAADEARVGVVHVDEAPLVEGGDAHGDGAQPEEGEELLLGGAQGLLHALPLRDVEGGGEDVGVPPRSTSSMEMSPVRVSPERVRYSNSSFVTRRPFRSRSRSCRCRSSSGHEPTSPAVLPITSRPYPVSRRKASLTSTNRPSGKVARVLGTGSSGRP